MYSIFIDAEWEPCTDAASQSAVCVNSSDGKDVLDALSRIFSVIESENRVAQDIGIMLAIAMCWKFFTIVIIVMKTSKVATIDSRNIAKIDSRNVAKVGATDSKTSVSIHDVSEKPIVHTSAEILHASEHEYAV